MKQYYKTEHKVHVTESAQELEKFLDDRNEDDVSIQIYPSLTGLLNVKAVIIVGKTIYIEEPIKRD